MAPNPRPNRIRRGSQTCAVLLFPTPHSLLPVLCIILDPLCCKLDRLCC